MKKQADDEMEVEQKDADEVEIDAETLIMKRKAVWSWGFYEAVKKEDGTVNEEDAVRRRTSVMQRKYGAEAVMKKICRGQDVRLNAEDSWSGNDNYVDDPLTIHFL